MQEPTPLSILMAKYGLNNKDIERISEIDRTSISQYKTNDRIPKSFQRGELLKNFKDLGVRLSDDEIKMILKWEIPEEEKR
jgi:hypothetical protein